MRRLRLLLQYEGTDYCGFQRQPDRPTVQGELETQLSGICGRPIGVTGAGRTDTGVHAQGQVVHFDIEAPIPPDRLEVALNTRLDRRIRALHVGEAPPGFHARFSALSRTYHYYFLREAPSPFLARYVLHEGRQAPDGLRRMRQALPALLGTHDFASFAITGSETATTERTVLHAELQELGPLVRLEIRADSFLRSMVRMVVGVLLEIGRGRLEPDAVADALQSGRRPGRVVPVPPHGLFLVQVEYPDGYPLQRGEALRGGPEELGSLIGNLGRSSR